MLEELRDRMTAFLSHHRVCVLSTAGAQGAWAMPVRYRNRGLEVDCLLPRWADVAYHVEQDPHVLLVIQDPPSSPLVGGTRGGLCWLQYQGFARPVAAPDWEGLLPGWTASTSPDELYLVIRVTPERIDLFDESRGWGARETLKL
ncbi:MAG: pyridoxamine 5'-phosphate oxidase family protein [Anaerolineae bacterium]